MKKTYSPRKTGMFPRSLAQTVHALTTPVMKKHGLPDGLIQQWPLIAGPQLASFCTPVGCKRSKKEEGATLLLAVWPSHSLMVQHASGVMLEKINQHYGYTVISRIKLQPATTLPAMPLPARPDATSQAMVQEFNTLLAALKQETPKQ